MYVVAALLHLSSLQLSVGGPEIIEDDVDEDEMEVFSDSRPVSSAVEDSLDPDMDNPIFIDPKLSSQKKLVERLHATQRTTKVSFSQRVIRRWNAWSAKYAGGDWRESRDGEKNSRPKSKWWMASAMYKKAA